MPKLKIDIDKQLPRKTIKEMEKGEIFLWGSRILMRLKERVWDDEEVECDAVDLSDGDPIAVNHDERFYICSCSIIFDDPMQVVCNTLFRPRQPRKPSENEPS